jgi:hypothetical protein
MKNNKAPGADGAEFDIIKESDYKSYKHSKNVNQLLQYMEDTAKLEQQRSNYTTS